jgi:2-C-methyl-D-erythritol 4-phosphate cytidylyltransferase
MNKSDSNFWAVIPAAGVGKRMGGERPKQYLDLLGKTIIEHTLNRLLNHDAISGVVLAISSTDEYWPEIAERYQGANVHVASGGAERCHSVLNALSKLSQFAKDDDWVLVHDAARPCLSEKDLSKLIDTLCTDEVGGILGVPVSDTLKRVNGEGGIETTVDRSNIWRALTPQMFRLAILKNALEGALNSGVLVTDEASAIEWLNLNPKMVEGSPENIKITLPQDLWLAECYLNNGVNQCE